MVEVSEKLPKHVRLFSIIFTWLLKFNILKNPKIHSHKFQYENIEVLPLILLMTMDNYFEYLVNTLSIVALRDGQYSPVNGSDIL